MASLSVTARRSVRPIHEMRILFMERLYKIPTGITRNFTLKTKEMREVNRRELAWRGQSMGRTLIFGVPSSMTTRNSTSLQW